MYPLRAGIQGPSGFLMCVYTSFTVHFLLSMRVYTFFYFYRWQNTRRYMLKEEHKSWWLCKVSKGHVTVWFKKELLNCSLNSGLTSFLNFGSNVRRNSIGNSVASICHSTQLPRAVSYITVAHEIGHNYGSPVSNKAQSIRNRAATYSITLCTYLKNRGSL